MSSFRKLKSYCFLTQNITFPTSIDSFFLFEAHQTLFELKNQKYSIKEINVGPYGPFPSGNVSQKASQHLTNLGGEIFSRLDFPKTSKANEIIFSPINTNISRNKVISFGKPSSIAVRMAEEF